MRTVIRNSFARHSVTAERVPTDATCAWCGSQRIPHRHPAATPRAWLYRFHVDDDSGPRNSGPIAGGRLFCSRGCAEAYTDRPFDETKGGA